MTRLLVLFTSPNLRQERTVSRLRCGLETLVGLDPLVVDLDVGGPGALEVVLLVEKITFFEGSVHVGPPEVEENLALELGVL